MKQPTTNTFTVLHQNGVDMKNRRNIQKIAKAHRFMDLLKAILKIGHFHSISCFIRLADAVRTERIYVHSHINFICSICSPKWAFMSASISLQPNSR